MERSDHYTAPRRIEQREGRALSASDILKRLELNQAHATQGIRSRSFQGGNVQTESMCCRALLGYLLKGLGKALLGGERGTPRDKCCIVAAKAANAPVCSDGDKEGEKGQRHPSNADCEENLAIHGCILSASTAPSTWVGYPLATTGLGGVMAKREKRFRPDQRPKLKPHSEAPKRGLTPAEEAAAAAYESTLVAPKGTVIMGASAPIGSRAASTQRLTAEIAEEMPIVRRDLRRIALTYGAMLALLAAIWFVATSTGFVAA